jgi:RNA polymerase sigma factor (sigma-70 family)
MDDEGSALSVEEAHRLIALIQANPSGASSAIEEAIKKVTTAFGGLVHWQAYKFHQPEFYEDLVQEGYGALLDAVNNFDVSRAVKFSTYATKAIRNRMIDLVQHEMARGMTGKYQPRLDPEVESGETNASAKLLDLKDLPEEAVSDGLTERAAAERLHIRECEEELPAVLDRLSERQQQALLLRFCEDWRPSDIAAFMNVSRPRVTALIQTGLEQTRRYMHVVA